MKHTATILMCLLATSALAQAPPPPPPKVPPIVTAPKGPPSFFLTSIGPGKGADLGGIDGADKQCQVLADAAGLGKHSWRAYLSTRAVDARDRIGKGPWFNTKGVQVAADVGDLHGDTLAQARNGNLISKSTALSEKGEQLPGEGDKPNYHDVLTGTQTDGRRYTDDFDHTCSDWTSSRADGSAQLGHFDRNTGSTSISWNSVHASRGCSQENLISTGGNGLFYCFAAEPR